MPVRPQKKSTADISDEQILKTLREAVLNQIGDTAVSKKAVQKITAEGLSFELKSIGEKLIQRQVKAMKKGSLGVVPKLTAKELVAIQRASINKPAKKSLAKKIISKSQSKIEVKPAESSIVDRVKVKFLPTTSSTTKTRRVPEVKTASNSKSATADLSVLPTSIKLLPQPTKWERISYIFTKISKLKILLFLSIIFLIVGSLGLHYVIYRVDWQNRAITTLVNGLHLSVIEVNNHKISFEEFNQDVKALEKFYLTNPPETVNGAVIPSREQIKQSVLDRQIRILLVKDALEKFNEQVSQTEIAGTLEEMKTAAGGEEALLKILTDLYGWTFNDFIKKAIVPILEEEKLSVLISQDVELNAGKEQLIKNIYNEIKAGRDFAELAKAYSEDSTASLGGDLDWFTKGSFIPSFEEQVLKLKIGEVSEPFKTDFGWHIVTLTNQDEKAGTYRASQILVRYLSVDEFIAKIKPTAKIKVFIKLPPV